MALSVGELVAYLKVDDKDFNSKLGGGEKRFSGFAAAAAKYAAAVGAATLAAGAVLLKVGSDFNAMKNTIIVGTGASEKALDGLLQSARNIGKTTPSSFGDVGTAVADLNTRLGLTGKPLERLSAQMLNMSRITKTDLSSNIANVTRVFGDWGISTDGQGKALDTIFEATKRTGIGLDQLTQSVVQFGAPLRQMGFGFEESLALFGKWEKEGVNTQVVLAGMKMGLATLSKAGEEPVAALARITDEIKNAGSAGEANRIAMELFGKRAGPDMAAAIREGRFEIADLVAGLKNSEGAIDDADKRTRTFTDAWQLFKNNAMLAVEPAATRLFDALGQGMEWINATGLPAVLALTAALSDRLGPAFEKVRSAVATVIGWMQDHAKTIKKVAAVLVGVLSPVLLLIAVQLIAMGVAATVSAVKSVAAFVAKTAAAVAYGAAMYVNSVKVIASFVAMGAAAVAQGARTVAVWAQITVALMAHTAAHVAQVARQVGAWVLLGAQSLLHAAKVAAAWLIAMGPIGLVIAAVVGLVALIVLKWDAIRAKTAELWNAVKALTSAAWSALKSAVSAGISAVVGFFTGMPGKILGALGNLGGLLTGAGKAVIEGFLKGITGAFGKVKDTLGKLTSMLPDWKGPATRDAVILRDAGRLVMGGFESGLVDKFGDVKRTLGSLTGDLGAVAGVSVGGARAPQPRPVAGGKTFNLQVVTRDAVNIRDEFHRMELLAGVG